MNKGFQYENKILNLMKSINLVPEEFVNRQPAGSDSTQPDLILNLKGKNVNVEIKENIRAQAGGTSIRYIDGSFSLVKSNEDVCEDEIYNVLYEKKNHIDNLIEFHKSSSIPFATTKDLWIKSVEKNLLKNINTKIESKSEVIENHYVNKDTYYIHIGGKGLYYMKDDILNLGVPRLKSKVRLEIRATRNGSRLNKQGVRICNATLRMQSRILELEKSPYSLENISSITSLAS